jgi:hypothetical protein
MLHSIVCKAAEGEVRSFCHPTIVVPCNVVCVTGTVDAPAATFASAVDQGLVCSYT